MKETLIFVVGLAVGGLLGWGVTKQVLTPSEAEAEESRLRNLSEMNQTIEAIKEHTAAMETAAAKLAKANSASAVQAQTIVTPV